jgi:hypothetical protein
MFSEVAWFKIWKSVLRDVCSKVNGTSGEIWVVNSWRRYASWAIKLTRQSLSWDRRLKRRPVLECSCIRRVLIEVRCLRKVSHWPKCQNGGGPRFPHKLLYVSHETAVSLFGEPETRFCGGNFRRFLCAPLLLVFWSKDCFEIWDLYLSLIYDYMLLEECLIRAHTVP